MEDSNTRKRFNSDDEVKVFEPILVRLNRNGNASRDIRIDKSEFKIGRARDNDEIILDTLISRKHCILKYEGDGEWILKDISSSYTFVNDIALERGTSCKIFVGDVIQFSTSSDYKYVFTLKLTEQHVNKRQCIDEQLLDNVLMKQRTFVENQESQRKELKDKIQTKQKEQTELRQQLEDLLKQWNSVKDDKKYLKNQIVTLERKIEAGNDQKKHLQCMYSTLLEKLENERTQFEARLNEERKKWQEALDISKRETDLIETKMKEQMEKWREEQQAEWRSMTENRVKEEKTIQAQLLIEKLELEKQLNETVKALQHKRESGSMQSKHAPGTSALAEESCIFLNVTDSSNLKVIDTIDLTENNVDDNVASDGVIDKVSNIMDEQLTCSVCSELFIKATTLNCTHTFCLHCINAWNKKRKECPICRAPVESMNRSLVLDNFIDKMLENLPRHMKDRRAIIMEERKERSSSRIRSGIR